MKKYIIILAAMCALFACQKNEIELLDRPIIEELGNGQVTYTFTAVIADDVTDAETKASVARNGAYTWAVNDALKFFKENGESADAKVTAIVGSTATITVTTEGTKADFVSAVYPATAGDGAYKINFNARGPIVVSAVNGGTLQFYHIGSLINLKFTSIPAETQSLVFTPASAFGYDGTFSFSGRVPSLTATGSTDKIVVPATTSDEGADITVCVPSVSLSGFSAALNNASGGNGRNLFKKSTSTTHDLATGRPVLMNLKSVACEAAKMYYMRISSTTQFWDSDSELLPMIKTGANEYTLFANSDYDSTYKIVDEYNIDNFENGALYSGSTTGQTVSKNHCLIIGNHTSPEWSLTNGTSMDAVWEWCFAKNVTTLSGKYFKFNYTANTTDWTKVYSTNNSTDFWLAINGYDTGIGQGDGKKAYYLNASEPVDIYFHPSYGVYVKANGAKDGKVCAVFKYILDTTKDVDPVSVARSSDPSLNAFAADFPSNTYIVKGAWDSWAKHYSTSFSNLSFTSEEITVGSDGTYEFGLSDDTDDTSDSFWTALKEGRGTINPGSTLYGTLTYWDSDKTNATVSLTTGTYIVYANATNDEGRLNLMFVKQ